MLKTRFVLKFLRHLYSLIASFSISSDFDEIFKKPSPHKKWLQNEQNITKKVVENNNLDTLNFLYFSMRMGGTRELHNEQKCKPRTGKLLGGS